MFNDIHGFRKRYERMLIMIENSEISKKNKEMIISFTKAKKRQISYPAVVRYSIAVYQCAKWLKSDMDKLTIEQIDNLFEDIDSGVITKNNGLPYSYDSYVNYKLSLKVFLRYIDRNDLTDEINTTKKRDQIDINNLWTEIEINKLLDSIEDIQDKAIASMTIDSGARIGEIGSMTISNVILTREGLSPEEYLIQITGKTGARTVMLTWSKEYVLRWIEKHPQRNKSNAPLWLNRDSKPKKYVSFRMIFKKAKKKCGINKPANPHNFRKSMTTILRRKGYDIELIKKRHGWTRNSQIMDRYEAIDNEAVWNEERRINGLEQKRKQILPNVKTCPFCHSINQIGAVNCQNCKEIIDLKERENIMLSRQKEIMEHEFNKMMHSFAKKPMNKLKVIKNISKNEDVSREQLDKFGEVMKGISSVK